MTEQSHNELTPKTSNIKEQHPIIKHGRKLIDRLRGQKPARNVSQEPSDALSPHREDIPEVSLAAASPENTQHGRAEQVEQNEPSPSAKDIFSRDKAVQRARSALANKAVTIDAESFQALETGASETLDIDGNKIEIRTVNGLSYPLLYDPQAQRYAYVGIDGREVPIFYPEDESPSIMFAGGSMDAPKVILTGDTPEVRAQVVRLTDRAVSKIRPAFDRFENTFNGELKELSDEAVSDLSMQEYIALMKRLSGHFATHLSRIGVRDMTGGAHNIGAGMYFGAMQDLLQHGSVISPKDARSGETSTALMQEALGTDTQELRGIRSPAVNVAPEKVDRGYAAEAGNEPFVLWPAEVVVANHTFSERYAFDPRETGGWANWELSGLTRDPHDSSNWVSLNSGIVFLSRSARVDPQTGSQYQVEDGRGVLFKERIDAYQRLLQSDEDLPEELIFARNEFLMAKRHSYFSTAPSHIAEKYEHEVRSFLEKYGFDKKLDIEQMEEIAGIGLSGNSLDFSRRRFRELDNAQRENGSIDVSDGNTLNYLIEHNIKPEDATLDDIRQAFLQNHLGANDVRALYRPAEQTVSSQEFWEHWFAQHPDARPTRVHYYDGDPNSGIAHFLVKNGIIPREDVSANGERLHSLNTLDSANYLALEGNNRKLMLPPGTHPDLGKFMYHEWGMTMNRIAEEQSQR